MLHQQAGSGSPGEQDARDWLKASGVNPWNREPRLTSSMHIVCSSCIMPVDKVGWVTPQAFRRTAEMLLPGQREKKFKLVDQ